MRITIITLFPEFFDSPLGVGVVGRAITHGLVRVERMNPRDYTTDRHRQADDYAFGGGPGMVLKPEPLVAAIRAAKGGTPNAPVLATSPGGKPFTDAWARQLAAGGELVIVCGRYEGVDQRVIDYWCDDEFSVGDFVLSGGEAAALCALDAVSRHVPGVVGNEENAADDSFAAGLRWPVYTRPEVFEDRAVPPVLLSGDEAAVQAWRLDAALARTAAARPAHVIAAGRHRIALEHTGDAARAAEIANGARGLAQTIFYVSDNAAAREAFRVAAPDAFTAHPRDADEKLHKRVGAFQRTALDTGNPAAARAAVADALTRGVSIVVTIGDGESGAAEALNRALAD